MPVPVPVPRRVARMGGVRLQPPLPPLRLGPARIPRTPQQQQKRAIIHIVPGAPRSRAPTTTHRERTEGRERTRERGGEGWLSTGHLRLLSYVRHRHRHRCHHADGVGLGQEHLGHAPRTRGSSASSSGFSHTTRGEEAIEGRTPLGCPTPSSSLLFHFASPTPSSRFCSSNLAKKQQQPFGSSHLGVQIPAWRRGFASSTSTSRLAVTATATTTSTRNISTRNISTTPTTRGMSGSTDKVRVGHHVHSATSAHHLHTLSSAARAGGGVVPEKGLGVEDPSQPRHYHRTMNQLDPTSSRDYIPIADHALIGNLLTAALVSLDGSIESYCVPYFDSPSVFARILDKDKGGHFSVTPREGFTTKQNYLPSSNVLQTKFMNEGGVVSVTDFLPRLALGVKPVFDEYHASHAGAAGAGVGGVGAGKGAPGKGGPGSKDKPMLQWLIRRVECVRGSMPLRMQCAPAFNYARDAHEMRVVEDDSIPLPLDGSGAEWPYAGNFGIGVGTEGGGRHGKALFEAPGLTMDLRWVAHDAEAGAEHGSGYHGHHQQQQRSPTPSPPGSPEPELPASFSSTSAHSSSLHTSSATTTDATTTTDDGAKGHTLPHLTLEPLDLSSVGHKGLGVQSDFWLKEGEGVTFVFRIVPGGDTRASTVPSSTPTTSASTSASQAQAQAAAAAQAVLSPVTQAQTIKKSYRKGRTLLDRRPGDDPWLTEELVRGLMNTTAKYWSDWIRQSTYTGSWKESVLRSALALKLLIFEPTGAVVASPTFSLPEFIGGVRNWDYRFSWIRDSSFTLYALIRLGFTEEANAYLDFIFARIRSKNPDGSLNIMYTIHGGTSKDMEEVELEHLDGHKGSRPVRIGNGASDHVQLDIYGELMDCIYLGQKFGKPLSYDDWVLVREIVDYVVEHTEDPDLSIWEVRDMKRNFTYSKIMMWVAIDRGLRLADKRSLPCPNRFKWLSARDQLYEDIMHKAWNKTEHFFGQSYEETDIVDAAVLIMPLVFFMQASDPRFVSTLKRIMRTPEKGGLTANNLVYRYDVRKSGDGVGGEEGTFCLCTLWCVEALTRAGKTDKVLLGKAVSMFEDFLLYLNHVGLCTEEISDAGEALGNAVQGFTHVTLISAAYNLSRTMHQLHKPTV